MEQLLLTVKRFLSESSVKGIHCCLDSSQTQIKDLYYKIGFTDYRQRSEGSQNDVLVIQL